MVSIFFVIMASSSLMLCLGCGRNITNVKGNRLLRTDSSRHVVPLWTSLMEDEYNALARNRVWPRETR